METKRLILAIALSIIVITGYQYFFGPKTEDLAKQPIVSQQEVVQDKQEKPTETVSDTNAKTNENAKSILDSFSKKKEEPSAKKTEVLEAVGEDLKGGIEGDITVETDLFTAVFTNKGVGLKSFILKKYKDDNKQLLQLISDKLNEEQEPNYPLYFWPHEESGIYKHINKEIFTYSGRPNVRLGGDDEVELVFRLKDKEQNLSVLKKFVISNNNYVLGIEYEIIKDGKRLPAPFMFGPDLENNIDGIRLQNNLTICAYNGEEVDITDLSKVKTLREGQGSEEIASSRLSGFHHWVAYQRAFFAVIFKTESRDASIRYFVVKDKLNPKEEKFYSYMVVDNPDLLYIGPKDEQEFSKIEAYFPDVNKTIDYGWKIFAPIAKIMLKGIIFIYKFIPNYGWALVIFTILLKIILFPLTYTSSVSMAKMQTLQPKIKAIKKKYKNLKDPEQRKQMNMETMTLYKQEKVNPAGGCLPLLLQMPILFAFFRLIPASINFRHEPWILWIQDLSLKDPIYVLPILMGVTQIIVSKMSPTGGDASQKKIMYIMPVVMVVLFINFSSGLNLYFFISNLLQIGQQYIINKRIYSKKKEEDTLRKVQKRKKGVKAK
jgi:YidC/Oxa1 family membrane protein insertase